MEVSCGGIKICSTQSPGLIRLALETERETEKERDTERGREGDRETQREGDRERETERETERGKIGRASCRERV